MRTIDENDDATRHFLNEKKKIMPITNWNEANEKVRKPEQNRRENKTENYKAHNYNENYVVAQHSSHIKYNLPFKVL